MVMKVVKTYTRTKKIYYKFKGILLMLVSLQTFGLIFFSNFKNAFVAELSAESFITLRIVSERFT